MRKVILPAFILFTALTAQAQKFEIGLNGGICTNTAPANEGSYFTPTKGLPVSPAASLGVLHTHGKWRYGIEADVLKLSYREHYNQYYLINGQLVELVDQGKATAALGNPAIPIKAVLDRTYLLKKISVYGGISAGYVFVTSSRLPVTLFSPSGPVIEYATKGGQGVTAGLHAGATYFVTKRMGVNANLGCDYMRLTVNNVAYDHIFAFPLTAGIRYRL